MAQMHLVGRRLDRLTRFARELAWLDVPERVDRRLSDLADRFGRPGPGGTSVAIRLTQDDLAALCGTSRESANRALRALRERDRVCVLGRGRYLVRDQVPVPGSPGAEPPAPEPSWSSTRLHVLQ